MSLARLRGLSAAGWQGLALLAAGAVLLIALAAAPLAYGTSVTAAMQEARDFEALLDGKLRLAKRDPKAATLSAESAAGAFVAGRTPGLAAAELQRIVGAAAAEAGVAIARLQPLEAETQGQAMALRLELDATGTIVALRDFLHSVETGAPLIFIREAHIGVGPGETPQDLVLRLQFEAFGWGGAT